MTPFVRSQHMPFDMEQKGYNLKSSQCALEANKAKEAPTSKNWRGPPSHTLPRHLEKINKIEFSKILGATKPPKQQQFWGFQGAHVRGYMGLAATTWVPMSAEVPVLSPSDHPNLSQGRRKGFGKSRIFEIFHRPPNSQNNRNCGFSFYMSVGLCTEVGWGGGVKTSLRSLAAVC